MGYCKCTGCQNGFCADPNYDYSCWECSKKRIAELEAERDKLKEQNERLIELCKQYEAALAQARGEYET